MAQSPELTKFYRDYLAWIEAGAPEDHTIFRRWLGLCTNLSRHCRLTGVKRATYDVIDDEMAEQFRQAGLSKLYPFNQGRGAYYEAEMDFDEAHINEARIRWVREHANG